MMQVQTGKNSVGRFWLLLAIWAVFTLVIPVSYRTYTSVESVRIFLTKQPITAPNEFLYNMMLVSIALGSAALIYIAARYSFRRCLLLAAAWLVVEIPYNIASIVIVMKIDHQKFTFYDGLQFSIVILIDLAVLVATITLVRLFAVRIKREWAVLLCALAAVFLLPFISRGVDFLITSAVNSVFPNPALPHQAALGVSGYLHLFLVPLTLVLINLRSLLVTAAGYGLLALIFMEHKKEKFRTFFANTKVLTKKVWEATAK